MRALGRKNYMFFGNARPKSNARTHLKQRKNIVALCLCVAHSVYPYPYPAETRRRPNGFFSVGPTLKQ